MQLEEYDKVDYVTAVNEATNDLSFMVRKTHYSPLFAGNTPHKRKLRATLRSYARSYTDAYISVDHRGIHVKETADDDTMFIITLSSLRGHVPPTVAYYTKQ